MKNRHIGNFRLFNEDFLVSYKGNVDEVIFERITELTIYFKKYSINIYECCIHITNSGNIKIKCYSYAPKLFDAFKSNDKILMIEEKGNAVDPKNCSELLRYMRIYKKYKIISVSGGSSTEDIWTYTLKPCL